MADLDHRIFKALYGGGGNHAIWVVMVALSVVGSGWSLLFVVPFFRASRTRRFAALLTMTLVADAILVQSVKYVVHRIRPCCGTDAVLPLWGSPMDPSFPSGHAAGSFGFAAFMVTLAVGLGFRGPRLYAPLATIPLAALIGLSRIYLGVHYPSDVLAGSLLGVVVGVVGARVFVKRERAIVESSNPP